MIGVVRNLLDRWRGSGGYAATVPPMDGVLGPNEAIEQAPVLLEAEAPDNLVADRDRILFSDGARIMRLDRAGGAISAAEVARFDSVVTALAARDGTLAVGLEGGGVQIVGGRHGGKALSELDGRPLACPTALLLLDADTLLVALGSRQNPPSRWRHDLMEKNASGSVWRCDLAGGKASCLADGLAWPAGLHAAPNGAVTLSESWRHRLVEIRPGAKPAVVLADLPGYPGRFASAAGGGAWLSVFAPRSQLVEFVLREDDFRTSMLREIEPSFWIAPSLSPTRSFLEPMQLGGLKQLGLLKPWAPTRSYGLVVGLDGAGAPRASFHSRADGRRHGITSTLEAEGRLLATSRGGGAIVSIPLGQAGAGT